MCVGGGGKCVWVCMCEISKKNVHDLLNYS